MTVGFAGVSHPGRSRSNNEDVVGWDEARGLWLVADGMGGHASGEVASRIVRDTLLAESQQQDLASRVCEAHRAILETARQDAAFDGMGSTVVAVWISGAVGHFVWVGDSRAYLLRGRDLKRLTRDHSFIELLRERDQLTEAQLRNHPNRNVVTQTLGLGEPNPSAVEVSLKSGDRILLCSDGLNDELTDEEIAEVLGQSSSPELAARHLVDSALDHGGRDNVSVIVLEYRGGGEDWWRPVARRIRGWLAIGRRN